MSDHITGGVDRLASLGLDAAGGLADGALGLKAVIAAQSARCALHAAADGVCCATDLVFVHGPAPPLIKDTKVPGGKCTARQDAVKPMLSPVPCGDAS
jgi:hypothetical protein